MSDKNTSNDSDDGWVADKKLKAKKALFAEKEEK